MTVSTFGWLDHDDGERRRMMEIINLFREKSTLDELGIGAIRDTFADHFFPGTSTIQTRARYFLFIPWLYRQIERDRIPSHRAAAHARKLQGELVRSLLRGGAGSNQGVIGIDAGENLQRLPSSIYWHGLWRWGIRTFEGTIDRYHSSLDAMYAAERAARVSDGGELLTAARRNWHHALPPAPPDLLDQTTLALTLEEAEFLTERIQQSAPESLLAACLSSSLTRQRQARAPWDLGGLESLPRQLREDIADAERASLLLEGAALLYNLMLAEGTLESGFTHDTTRLDRYRTQIDRWSDEVAGSLDDLRTWDRPAFWYRMRVLNPGLPHGVQQFGEAWFELAIAAPRSVHDDGNARRLIRAREYRLKRALARLSNPKALERWSGDSGLGRLTYRWGSAQRILQDILDGRRSQRVSAA